MAQLNIRTQNEDGDPVTHTLHIEDEHAEEEAQTVEQLAERAERAAELRQRLNKAQHDLAAVKETLVSEVVRLKKLSGELSGESDIEDEREFLEGLPVGRLRMHYERAQELDVNTDGNLDPSKSPSDGPSPYDDVAVEA